MIKRSDGRWQERVVINGKPKYFYGKTKNDVIRKIAEYKVESESKAKGIPFDELADEWWESIEDNLSANTIPSYRSALNRAKARFGSTPAPSIKAPDVKLFISDFVRHTNAAEKTVKTQLMIVRQIFAYGVEYGKAESNPAIGVKIDRGLRKRTVEMPSSDVIQKIKENTDSQMGMVAYWLLYTGLRHGELLALTWDDVDMENRTISVTKSLYHRNGQHIKEPKTEKGKRIVPILDKLFDKIEPGTGLVFPNDNGNLYNDGSFHRKWSRYTESIGIECTPHQLRHAYATMLVEAGVLPQDAQLLLGHAQISTTMDVYRTIRDQHRVNVGNSILSLDIS